MCSTVQDKSNVISHVLQLIKAKYGSSSGFLLALAPPKVTITISTCKSHTTCKNIFAFGDEITFGTNQ